MAHFIVQRFSAAFILTTIVAFCGFFAFGAQVSWFGGFIFLIYLYALTTFLNLLGKSTQSVFSTDADYIAQVCSPRCIDSAAL